jgi:hypothetical protein
MYIYTYIYMYFTVIHMYTHLLDKCPKLVNPNLCISISCLIKIQQQYRFIWNIIQLLHYSFHYIYTYLLYKTSELLVNYHTIPLGFSYIGDPQKHGCQNALILDDLVYPHDLGNLHRSHISKWRFHILYETLYHHIWHTITT